MAFGQGKDPNADWREKRRFGFGLENVGQFIGGAITAGFGAANGDQEKTQQGLSQMGASVNSFANKVNVNKQMSSGNLSLTDPNAAVPTKPGWGGPNLYDPHPIRPGWGGPPQVSNQNNTAPEGSAAKAASTSMDTGAGYNPQSETFRSGSGQTITDRNKTFEQQAAGALMKNNTLMASKGQRINYLSFFN